MQSTEKVLSLLWVSHSSPLGQSPSKVTRALWPNLNPTGEEKWWYFKIKMLRGGPCSSQIEGPRTQIAIFLILSTQEGAQLSYGNDYMGSSQDALFQFDKGVDWKYVLSDINMIEKILWECSFFSRENCWKKRGLCIIPTKFGISFTSAFLNQVIALYNSVHLHWRGAPILPLCKGKPTVTDNRAD